MKRSERSSENLEKEIADIYYLYEEIRSLVKDQDDNLELIDDFISNSQEDLQITEEELNISENITPDWKRYYLILSGAGIGSLFYLYSPYLILPSIIGGSLLGDSLSKYLNKNYF